MLPTILFCSQCKEMKSRNNSITFFPKLFFMGHKHSMFIRNYQLSFFLVIFTVVNTLNSSSYIMNVTTRNYIKKNYILTKITATDLQMILYVVFVEASRFSERKIKLCSFDNRLCCVDPSKMPGPLSLYNNYNLFKSEMRIYYRLYSREMEEKINELGWK